MDDLFCKCKNTCCRRDSNLRKGCPCKTRGVKCSEKCSCGKRKRGVIVDRCKNRIQLAALQDQDPQLNKQASNADEWDDYESELKGANKKIQEYLCELSREDLISIIIETNNEGRGSLDSIKDSLAFVKETTSETETTDDAQGSPPPPPPPPPPQPPSSSKPDWCKCSKCRDMPTLVENKCCGRKNCITLHAKFGKFCLDKDILILNIKARADIRAEQVNVEKNKLRKASYRQFILWKHGRLGRYERRVAPSCVVLAVRRKFPSRDGVYMGYKPR
eukprot:TCONS_00036571-protein